MFSEGLKTGTVPFFVLAKERMKPVKTHEMLWSGISILIGVVIAVLALVHDPWRTRILLTVVVAWGVWAAVTLLRPRQVVRRRERAIQASLHRNASSGAGQRMADMLLRHVNCRISERLRVPYPDVKWEWETESPIQLIMNGGIGRIRLHGVPEYDFAEVKVDRGGGIQCALLRIEPLPNGAAPEEEVCQTDGELVDPKVWYELQGRNVLQNMIADLESRGHKSLTMNEDGTITVADEKGGKTIQAFSSFPSRVCWPQTVRVLESEGYAAEIDGDAIAVTW